MRGGDAWFLSRGHETRGYSARVFRLAFRLSNVVLVAALLAGCGWMPWGRRHAATEKEIAGSRRAALVVGRVSLVNAAERFALIEENMVQAPAAGTLLRIYSGSVLSAELRATGVRRRPFLVADFVSGTPAKGDSVVQPMTAEANPPRATAVTPEATPSPAAPPGWKRWLGFFGGRK